VIGQYSTPEDVLTYYGINFRRGGKELSFFCPFHVDKTSSASMNVNTGLWYCHSCGAKGNIFIFMARQEGITVEEAQELVYAPAFILSELKADIDRDLITAEPVVIKESSLPGFAKMYFLNRGFSMRTILGYGVTYDAETDRAIMRVADRDGKVAGAIGRSMNVRDKPKYLFSEGLQKKRFLFGHAQAVHMCRRLDVSKVVIVEGPLDALKSFQYRTPAVALMGALLSEAQVSLLASDFDYVLIAADVDPAGRELESQAVKVLEPVYGNRIRILPLPEKDLCDCSREEFSHALRSSYSPLVFDIDRQLGGSDEVRGL